MSDEEYDHGQLSAQATSPSRREWKKARARERLYEAALRLFREEGFEETPVERITAAAGTAKGTFFNYFPTKEHVLVAYHQRMMAGILERMEGIDPGASAEEGLQAALALCAEAVEADLPMGRVVLGRMFASEALLGADRSTGRRFHDWFVRRAEEGVARGELRPGLDVGTLVALVTGVLSTTTLAWVTAGQPFDLRAEMRRRVRFLFDAARR